MDMDPENDCVACAYAGTQASDAGTCNPEAQTCFNSPNNACLDLNDCIIACPDSMTDMAGFLDCLCTHSDVGGMETCNEDMMPAQQSMPGTCFGDFPAGVEPLTALLGCINGVCAAACM